MIPLTIKYSIFLSVVLHQRVNDLELLESLHHLCEKNTTTSSRVNFKSPNICQVTGKQTRVSVSESRRKDPQLLSEGNTTWFCLNLSFFILKEEIFLSEKLVVSVSNKEWFNDTCTEIACSNDWGFLCAQMWH